MMGSSIVASFSRFLMDLCREKLFVKVAFREMSFTFSAKVYCYDH